MQLTETITLPCSPTAAWAVVGDVGAVADWVPAIRSSTMEGPVRVTTTVGGDEARERIVDHDDPARTYSYEYLSGPIPLQRYVSRIRVQEDPQGCLVVWTADFTGESPEVEEQLAAAVRGIYRDSLTELGRALAGA